ncbi:Small subunit processome component 20 [Thelohanellus kitauei]|uniref:Small subunit processome component 20 n=1 Tax=Thelohanellus kitauei TaxID=669202 RepID=A0A0C2IA58_THEKT|nr:Small subunit processome component 20 [Thelohanellus kitauei]
MEDLCSPCDFIYLFDFSDENKNEEMLMCVTKSCPEPEEFQKIMENIENVTDGDLFKFFAYFVSRIRMDSLNSCYLRIEQYINQNDRISPTLVSILYLCSIILSRKLGVDYKHNSFFDTKMLEILKVNYNDKFVLGAFLAHLTGFKMDNSRFDDVLDCFIPNLISSSRVLRVISLKILAVKEELNRLPPFYSHILAVELIEPDFFNYRQRNMKLQKLLMDLSEPNLATLRPIIYFLVSHFTINLSVMYPFIEKMIVSLHEQPRLNTFFSKIWRDLFISSIEKLTSSLDSSNEKYIQPLKNGEVYLEHGENDSPILQKEDLNMYRKIMSITLKFKSIQNDSLGFIFNHFKYLYSRIPVDVSLAPVSLSYFYRNHSDSSIFTWKEMIIFCIQAVESCKHIETLPFSDEFFEIIFDMISVPFPELSKICLSCASKFKKKLSCCPDDLLEYYDLKGSNMKHKLSKSSQYYMQYQDSCSIMIKVLFSIVSSTKSNDPLNKVFYLLINSQSSNSDDFFDALVNFLFSKCLIAGDHLLHPRFTAKFVTTVSSIVVGFRQKWFLLFPKLVDIVLNICKSSILIFDDQFVIQKYKTMYRDIFKSSLELFLHIFSSGFSLPQMDDFHIITIYIIKHHQNSDLQHSFFIELMHGLSNTTSCDYLINGSIDSRNLVSYIVECINASITRQKLSLILKIVSNILNIVKDDQSFNIMQPNLYLVIQYLTPLISADAFCLSEFFDVVKNITSLCQHFQISDDLICQIISLLVNPKLLDGAKEMVESQRETVYCVCRLLIHLREPQQIFDQIIFWQLDVADDCLRAQIVETLRTCKLFDDVVYAALVKLNSWQTFDNFSGPDISLRTEILRQIGLDFVDIYKHNPHIIFLIFVNSLKSLETCMDQFLMPLAFSSFLDTVLSATTDQENKCFKKMRNILKEKCRKFLNSKKESVFHCGVLLMANLIKDDVSAEFQVLKPLNEEAFENLMHIQVVHKIAGLKALKAFILEQNLSKNMIENYILPIAIYFITNEKSADSSNHNLTHEGIELFGALAQQISWSKYRVLMKIFTKDTNFIYDDGLKEQKKRTRVLTALLDNFRFTISDIPAPNCVLKKDLWNLVQSLVDKVQSKTVCKENKSWMPAFTDIKHETIKAPLCLAIIHLTRILNDEANFHLNGVIIYLAELLANQHKDMRVSGRTILKKAIKILGPGHLTMIIGHLKAHLKDGFQRHVYLYTIHQIISGLDASYSQDINNCTLDIVEAIILDQFGVIQEERQIHTITSKTIEAYKGKGPELCEIVGQHIDIQKIEPFFTSFANLSTKLSLHSALKSVEKCFNRFLQGIKLNANLSAESLSELVGHLIHKYMPSGENSDQLKVTTIKTIPTRLLPPDPRKAALNAVLSLQLDHLIVCWSLTLLHHILIKKIQPNSVASKTIMDIHFQTILSCIESPFIQIAAKSFLCLKYFLKNNYEALSDRSNDLLHIVYSFVNEMITSGMNFEDIVTGFKIIVLILRRYSSDIDETMAKNLVLFAENNLMSGNSSCLSLLKIILTKKIDGKQITTSMKTIRFVSITASDESLQSACQRLVIIYLKNFKRHNIIEDFTFYLGNLKHEMISGQISSLNMLNMMITELKVQRWLTYSHDIFFRLFELVCNDKNQGVISLAYEVIKDLIRRTSTEFKNKWFKSLIYWIRELKYDYIDAASIVIHAFIEADDQFIENYGSIITIIFESLKKIFQRVGFSVDQSVNSSDDLDVVIYKLINLLTLIHKKFKFSSCESYSSVSAEILGFAFGALKYPHLWVIQAACELVLDYLLFVGTEKIVEATINKCSNVTSLLWIPDLDNIDDSVNAILQLSNSESCTVDSHESGTKLVIILSEIIWLVTQKNQDVCKIKIENIFHILLKYANQENQEKCKNTRCRTTLLKWIAGMITISSSHAKQDHKLEASFLQTMIVFVNRMVNGSKKQKDLIDLAKNAMELIKNSMPKNEFVSAMSETNCSKIETSRKRKSTNAIMKSKDARKFFQSKKRRKLTRDVKKAIKSRSGLKRTKRLLL